MNNNKNDKGFTLVELLIVIVILGILATVTVFAVRGITTRGQDNACATDKKTFETAIEAYYALDTASRAGGGANPSEANLVAAQLVRAESPNLTITVASPSTVAFAGNCLPPAP